MAPQAIESSPAVASTPFSGAAPEAVFRDLMARHQDRLLRSLELYPAQGCCTSVGEVLPDVQAVAVPLARLEQIEKESDDARAAKWKA